MEKWKIADAVETYGIRNWGKGYFAINKHGHVTVQPNKLVEESIDLKDLIDQLQARSVATPSALAGDRQPQCLVAGLLETTRHRLTGAQ